MEDTIIGIVRQHREIGYLGVKQKVEYRLSTNLDNTDFEKTLVDMTQRGLIEFDGICVKAVNQR